MEYSAGNVSNLLWFVEMRETAKLLQNHDVQEVQRMVVEENIYQQRAENRARREINCRNQIKSPWIKHRFQL